MRVLPVSRSVAPWMFSRSRPLLCVIATGMSFGAQQPGRSHSMRRMHCISKHHRFIGRQLVQQCFIAPDECCLLRRVRLRGSPSACDVPSPGDVTRRSDLTVLRTRCRNPARSMRRSAHHARPWQRISDPRRQPRQLLRRRCRNASFVAETRQALDPILLIQSVQVRICVVDHMRFATTSQLMPSSNSSSALARRAKRCAAGRPRQLDQVLSAVAIQEARSDHSVSGIDLTLTAIRSGSGFRVYLGSHRLRDRNLDWGRAGPCRRRPSSSPAPFPPPDIKGNWPCQRSFQQRKSRSSVKLQFPAIAALLRSACEWNNSAQHSESHATWPGGLYAAWPDCVFCQIVADTGKCLLLAEDPETLAFMDIHPATPAISSGCPERPLSRGCLGIPPDAFAAVGLPFRG